MLNTSARLKTKFICISDCIEIYIFSFIMWGRFLGESVRHATLLATVHRIAAFVGLCIAAAGYLSP